MGSLSVLVGITVVSILKVLFTISLVSVTVVTVQGPFLLSIINNNIVNLLVTIEVNGRPYRY